VTDPQAHTIVCCSAIIEENGRFLLVSHGEGPAEGFYSLPGGKAEYGESLTEAACREVQEETGLVVAVKDLVGLYHRPRTRELVSTVEFVFSAQLCGGSITISSRHPEVRYCTYREIVWIAEAGRLRGSYVLLAVDEHIGDTRVSQEHVRQMRD
jgi:ADP-ribose pyrophosphatase YjhB (NUDIX family)